MGPSSGPNPLRDRWLLQHGYAPESTALRRQTHSRQVVVVERESAAACHIEADGMLSADRDLSLAVTVADCMPIFLFDRATGAFGLLHSGWKGTGVAAIALELMRRHWGIEAADLDVVLGPCIGACCYRVDETRARAYAAEWGGAAVRTGPEAAYYLDLRAANIALLQERGVARITVVSDCTVCNERLGSFRREGAERFTRMLAVMTGATGQEQEL